MDFEHSLIALKDPKRTRTETVPVNPEALDISCESSGSPPNMYVFLNHDGAMRSRSSARDTWKRMKKQAGLPADFRFYGLRHNFASWLVSNGVDLATVQRLMTHKNASTTQRHAHPMPGAAQDAAIKSRKLFGSVGKPQKVIKIGE